MRRPIPARRRATWQAVASMCAATNHGHRDRVRCDLHLPWPPAAEPRRGRPLPVPPGGVLGPQLQRLPPQRRPAVPRRRIAPRVRDRRVRQPGAAGHPRPGRRAGARGPADRRRAAAGRRGHRRRHLPVQEQHRLGGQLLRLPRELSDRPGGRVLPDLRCAAAVPGHPPADLRRGQGAADAEGRHVLPVPARRAHLGGRLVGDHPVAARSSTPATSRTPTPRSTGACTSSSATPTCARPPPCSRWARPRWCWR